MTTKGDLKSIIRDRQKKTGESYTAARAHVMRERARLLGEPEPEPSKPSRVEAAVLGVHKSGATIRILGESEAVHFRSRDVRELVPGHLVVIAIEKHAKYRGLPSISGKVERITIDVARLGLESLPLDGGDLVNLRDQYENVRPPDPYAPLWRKLTAKPRPMYEMDAIAWGELADDGVDDNPTFEAAEMRGSGDVGGAYDLLTETLVRDLRCLDGHAQLGNLMFDHAPARAIVHYDIGVRIGQLSFPAGFDGVLPWSRMFNRPFMRCLHGYGLACWRLGRLDEAARVFERMLAFNPNDNQGARFCLADVNAAVTWDAAQARDDDAEAKRAEAAKQLRAAYETGASRDDQQLN